MEAPVRPLPVPGWWTGIETVRAGGPGEFTQWPTGYPDFPMPHKLRVDPANKRVSVSCQVSGIEFTWQLTDASTRTNVASSFAGVHVRIGSKRNFSTIVPARQVQLS
jgi:hypothetical protein